jgi:hypothetical protein
MRLITPAQISSDAISASVTAHPSRESENRLLFFNSRFSLLCVVTEISPLRCGFFVRRFFKQKCRAQIPLVDFLQSWSWNFAEGSGVLPRGEDRPAYVEAKRGLILRWVGQQQRSSGRQATAIAIDRALAGFMLMPFTHFSLKNKKPAYQIQLWPAGFVSVKKMPFNLFGSHTRSGDGIPTTRHTNRREFVPIHSEILREHFLSVKKHTYLRKSLYSSREFCIIKI